MKTNQAYYHQGIWRYNERGWPEEPIQNCSQNLPRCEMVQFANCECNDAELKFIEALTSAIKSSVPFEDQGKILHVVGDAQPFIEDGAGVFVPKEGLYTIPELQVNRVYVPGERMKCHCICHKQPGVMHVAPCCDNGWIEGLGKEVARIVDSSPEPVKQSAELILPNYPSRENLILTRAINWIIEDDNSRAKEIVEELKTLISHAPVKQETQEQLKTILTEYGEFHDKIYWGENPYTTHAEIIELYLSTRKSK